MPSQSYPLFGVLKDSSENVVSGATVTCFNVNTGEWLKASAQSTTNSLGEYGIDLYNLDDGYSNNDTIQTVASSGDDRGTITHAVNTVTGFLNQNLYMKFRSSEFFSNVGISRIVDQIGSNFTISEVSSTVNTRGDATETETKYITRGVVDVMDGSEDIVKEGLLEKNDILIIMDYLAPATDKIDTHGYVYYNGIKYIIKDFTDNKGHFELLCKRY